MLMSLSPGAELYQDQDGRRQDDLSCHKRDDQGEIFDVTVDNRIKTGQFFCRLSPIGLIRSRSSLTEDVTSLMSPARRFCSTRLGPTWTAGGPGTRAISCRDPDAVASSRTRPAAGEVLSCAGPAQGPGRSPAGSSAPLRARGPGRPPARSSAMLQLLEDQGNRRQHAELGSELRTRGDRLQDDRHRCSLRTRAISPAVLVLVIFSAGALGERRCRLVAVMFYDSFVNLPPGDHYHRRNCSRPAKTTFPARPKILISGSDSTMSHLRMSSNFLISTLS